ncbi:MAG: anti-sigma factor [Chloroflexi bacterium]|nr:anti-sigma factor [Chloroflexota bacterium]
MDCSTIRDDLDLSVLGTLSPAEEHQVRAHAATCDRCRADLTVAEHTASSLALSVPVTRAPAALRAAVISEIISAPVTTMPGRPARRFRARGLAARYGGLAAALVLVPLSGLLVWAVLLQRQVNDLRESADEIQRRSDGLVLFAVPSAIKADFQPGPAAGGAIGAATWSPERGACFLLFDKLPRPEPGSVYRMWYIVDNGQRVVDAGELVVDEAGRADMTIDTSRWRGVTYDMVLRLEQRPHDPDAPAVLTASLRRP